MSEKTKKVFPNLLYLIDATTFDIQKPKNFLMNRLSYSAYKGANVLQVVFGMCAHHYDQFSGVNFVFLVTSTEKIFLSRSEVFGGITNEISGILDDGKLPELLESTFFPSPIGLDFDSFCFSSARIFEKISGGSAHCDWFGRLCVQPLEGWGKNRDSDARPSSKKWSPN
jgi:hypothetical protein